MCEGEGKEGAEIFRVWGSLQSRGQPAQVYARECECVCSGAGAMPNEVSLRTYALCLRLV